MTKAEKYLEKLRHEKEIWQAAVDALPGDTILTNSSVFRMSVNAANRYAVAKYMMQLMQEENQANAE